VVPGRQPSRGAALLHRPDRGRAPARGQRWPHRCRGPRGIRRARRPDHPPRLGDAPRPAARGAARGAADRGRAAVPARRDGRRRLRRLRGRPAGARPRAGRPGGGGQRRARPALPPDRGHARGERPPGVLQGVPAHRHLRARRGAPRPRAARRPRRAPAGHGRVRLPHDRDHPHHARAGAELGRPDARPGGPRRRALGVALPWLPPGPTSRRWACRSW
jgi:hypothetical protein